MRHGVGWWPVSLCLAGLLVLGALPLSRAAAGETLPAIIQEELHRSGEVTLGGDVVVQKEGTLVLAAGTVVRPLEGASLTIEGKLVVRGTQAAPVTFSPEEGVTWKGISLLSGAEGDLSFLGLKGATTGLSLIACRVTMNGGVITGSQTALHLVREAAARVRGVRFMDNKVGLAAEMRSTGEITGCFFKGNRIGLGIASGGTPQVRGNRFQGNELALQVLQRFPGKIEGNHFLENKAAVRLYQNGPDTLLERNLFENNTDASVLALSYTSPVIRNNFMKGGRYGIYANQFSSPDILDNVIVEMEEAVHLNKKNASTVRGNVLADSRVGLFCDFSSYPLLRENLFSRNETHIKLGKFQSSNWESRAGSRNYVLQSAAQQGSRNPKLGQGPTEFPEAVDAAGNWWDADTLAEMKEKGEDGDLSAVFDGHDLPEVTYEGFGDESYYLDKVLFLPAREGDPSGAGLKGWKGTVDELALGF